MSLNVSLNMDAKNNVVITTLYFINVQNATTIEIAIKHKFKFATIVFFITKLIMKLLV